MVKMMLWYEVLVLNSGMELGGLREEAASVYCRKELQNWRKWPEKPGRMEERSQGCVVNRALQEIKT